MSETLKLFELAKEMRMKHTELIPLLNEIGHDIKGFSKILTREQADQFKAEIKNHYIQKDLDAKQAIEDSRIAMDSELAAELEYQDAYKAADVAKMIGTYYCPIKRRYFIIEQELTPEQISDKIEGKGYGTIYNLVYDFNLQLGKRKILKPADLENSRKWNKGK